MRKQQVTFIARIHERRVDPGWAETGVNVDHDQSFDTRQMFPHVAAEQTGTLLQSGTSEEWALEVHELAARDSLPQRG